MKKFLVVLFILSSVRVFAIDFDRYFENRTLRIDCTHAGNATSDEYFIDELKAEPFWGGTHVNLIDTMAYGVYMVKVFDVATNTLIDSHGYCTLFDEWQATAEAKKTSRSFSETVVMPFPKKNVRVDFYTRNHKGTYDKK
ncbi:MAG: peptidase M64 N-terminal domain-containing protein, partial [Bacteroidota bacterium]|nr:peptidase M64 N-terminal domain-containing protein [Bacteroidota bacterium]